MSSLKTFGQTNESMKLPLSSYGSYKAPRYSNESKLRVTLTNLSDILLEDDSSEHSPDSSQNDTPTNNQSRPRIDATKQTQFSHTLNNYKVKHQQCNSKDTGTSNLNLHPSPANKNFIKSKANDSTEAKSAVERRQSTNTFINTSKSCKISIQSPASRLSIGSINTPKGGFTTPKSGINTPKQCKTSTSPITVGQVLRSLETKNKLTAYEQGEILEYKKIYFIGTTPCKIKGVPHSRSNNGYDDKHGDYRLVYHDHISYRYEILCLLGKGGFGQVVKVFDHKLGEFQALKIIRNKLQFHHQALVEVKLLKYCMDKDKDRQASIVEMTNSFYFRNHLCISFELLSLNLYDSLKNNKFKGYSLDTIHKFACQLLASLSFLNKNHIIHGDIKPENILIKESDTIKLIDFGSSCFDNERVFTYIQSRFYRSPEVILGVPYDCAIDMWSFACILPELYTGIPLFPGENEYDQLSFIIEYLGPPPDNLLECSSRKEVFFVGKTFQAEKASKPRKPKNKTFIKICQDEIFSEFIGSILKWNPDERLTPEQALKHPFITRTLKP